MQQAVVGAGRGLAVGGAQHAPGDGVHPVPAGAGGGEGEGGRGDGRAEGGAGGDGVGAVGCVREGAVRQRGGPQGEEECGGVGGVPPGPEAGPGGGVGRQRLPLPVGRRAQGRGAQYGAPVPLSGRFADELLQRLSVVAREDQGAGGGRPGGGVVVPAELVRHRERRRRARGVLGCVPLPLPRVRRQVGDPARQGGGRGARAALGDGGRAGAVGQRAQGLGGRLRGGGGDPGPVLVPAAAGGGGVREGRVVGGVEREGPLGVVGGEGAQRLGVLGGEFEALDGHGRQCRGRFRGAEDDVGVGAAHPEGADAGVAACLRAPVGEFGGQRDAGAGEVDPRVDGAQVHQRREPALAQAEHGLGESGDPGGGLQVAEVGLDGADRERRAAVAAAEGGGERLHLDRVAERGAGAVRLDVADVGGLQAGLGEGLFDDGDLGEHVGCGEAAGAAVLVDGGAVDHRVDAVAVALRVVEPLEDDDAAALAAGEAVGAGVEALAQAVRGERAGLADETHRVRRHDQVGAGGERDLALAAAQRLGGEVHGDQRGGAGGVDGHRRAGQAEVVGDPAGREVVAVAGGPGGLGLPREPFPVVLPHDAEEEAGPGGGEALDGQRGVLQRLPADLQQQPVLRVQVAGLAGADAEEGGVEVEDLVQEAAALRQPLPLGRERAAPLGRHRADEVAPGRQGVPVAVEVVDAAGQPQADPDHGDRLAALLLVQLPAQRPDGGHGAGERGLPGAVGGAGLFHGLGSSRSEAMGSSVGGSGGVPPRRPGVRRGGGPVSRPVRRRAVGRRVPRRAPWGCRTPRAGWARAGCRRRLRGGCAVRGSSASRGRGP